MPPAHRLGCCLCGSRASVVGGRSCVGDRRGGRGSGSRLTLRDRTGGCALRMIRLSGTLARDGARCGGANAPLLSCTAGGRCDTLRGCFIRLALAASGILREIRHASAGDLDATTGGLLQIIVGLLGGADIMLVLGQLLAVPLTNLFVGYRPELAEMTIHGFRIFALSFMPMGFAIFASSFFTALNDGLTSALISFLRTLIFQLGAVLLLPMIWQLDGIWISVVVAEVMAVIFSAIFLLAKRKKFQY